MKKSLLLYGFILAVLFNIYTYMFLNKEVKFEQEKFTKVTAKLRDSVKKVELKLDDANYFSLGKNENAQNYFEATNPDKTILIEKCNLKLKMIKTDCQNMTYR